ncbi:glycoside hydrolase family 20 zincin-like fold domain-containing protein, partial [Prevotella sp.]
MIKKVFIGAAFLLLSASITQPVCAQSIIPQPESITRQQGTFTLAKGLQGVTNLKGEDFKILNQYTSDVMSIPFSSVKNPAADAPLRLICTGTEQEAAMAADSVSLQGYELNVTPTAVTIQARTPMGLFYGLQTLRQLEKDRQIPCVKITDTPRFAYRGLMIDCSRHFWWKDEIKKQLDAMAYF